MNQLGSERCRLNKIILRKLLVVKTNSKKQWRVINSIIIYMYIYIWITKKRDHITVMNNNGNIISDQNVISNEFNKYYIYDDQTVITDINKEQNLWKDGVEHSEVHYRDNMVLRLLTASEVNKL